MAANLPDSPPRPPLDPRALEPTERSRAAGPPPDEDPFATRPLTGNEQSAKVEPSGSRRFHILRSHARGGLGEVFLAIDGELNREVALKEIQLRHADQIDFRARFVLEAEITGRLEHPGIVPIYGLGQYADGRPFYAMRFIHGETLAQAIDRFHGIPAPMDLRPLELRQLLSRFVAACNAIAYAHSRGILHRDLKPGNIMLGPFGETLVVDWGMAKPFEGNASSIELAPAAPPNYVSPFITPTQVGQVVGTPHYMSPEQAEGRNDQLGPTSDVYSLGATLYALLTGQPPIDCAHVEDILARVRVGMFPPPRLVRRGVPPALDAICMKAMALEPSRRYRSVQALIDELEQWLADEPVSAYQEPPLEKLARWGRRHKPLVVGLVVALLLIGMVTPAALWYRHEQEQQKRTLAEQAARAREEAGRNALAAEREQLRDRAATLVYLGDVALILGDAKTAGESFAEAIELRRRFLEPDPGNHAVRRELGITYLKAGDVELLQGRFDAARAMYQESLATAERIAELDPANPQSLAARMMSSLKLGLLEERAGRRAEARIWMQKTVELFATLRAEGQFRDAIFAGPVVTLAEQAKTLLQMKAGDRPTLLPPLVGRGPLNVLLNQAEAQARSGRHEQAAAMLDKAAALPGKRLEQTLYVARGYALCLAASEGDDALTRRYTEAAVRLLREVESHGYFKEAKRLVEIESSQDFTRLRERPEYQAWRTRVGQGEAPAK